MSDTFGVGALGGVVLIDPATGLPYKATGGGGGGGVTDHGALTGLADDDHPQYHNDTRGDARYVKPEALAAVATSGSYTDLDDKPTIPVVMGQGVTASGRIVIVESLDDYTGGQNGDLVVVVTAPVV